MAHDHAHHSGNIRMAFFLNLIFTVVELVGGVWTNSTAILADALHDLGDSFTLGLSWYFENVSRRGRTARFSYGYRRFSLLGALVSAAVLLGASLFVLAESIPRLLHPTMPDARGMIVFALLGIGVNGMAVLRLRGSAQSLNARSVMLHLLEDVLGWIAVLVVSVVLLFRPLPILDPILSMVITLYVLYNVVRNLRRTLSIFLQAVPENVDVEVVEGALESLDGVESVHHTHVWSLDGEHHSLTAHVVVRSNATRDEVMGIKKACKRLLGSLHFTHQTIEIEYADEECGASP